MKVIYPGHLYMLSQLDAKGGEFQPLQFVQRAPLHPPVPGTTNQEVLRVLIDRIKVLDAEVPWEGNQQILFHLRSAIALHESRAILRHIEKHGMEIEKAQLGDDGHLKLSFEESEA